MLFAHTATAIEIRHSSRHTFADRCCPASVRHEGVTQVVAHHLAHARSAGRDRVTCPDHWVGMIAAQEEGEETCSLGGDRFSLAWNWVADMHSTVLEVETICGSAKLPSSPEIG